MEIAIVYMVAGLSSRFGGKIKQFAKIGPKGETLIEYSLKQALPAGFTKIIFIVGEKTEKPFKERFGNNYNGVPVYYAFQNYDKEKRDKPWGTTDALCSAKNIINFPFVVCGGDDLFGSSAFKALVEHLKKYNNDASIGYRLIEVLPEKGKVNRAIFEIDKNSYIKNLDEIFNIEKLKLKELSLNSDDLCSMNIFALMPETLFKLNQKLENFKENYAKFSKEKNKNSRTAECLLPIEIANLIKSNQIKMKLYPATEKWFGITNPEDEELIREELKKYYVRNENHIF